MKIFIGLVSPRADVCEEYTQNRDKVVPKDLATSNVAIQKLAPTFAAGAFNPCSKQGNQSFEERLLDTALQMDAVVLLIDKSYITSDHIKNAFFTAEVEIPAKLNFNNFFQKVSSKVLKGFAAVQNLMCQSDNEQAMTLPLRNFLAPELNQLALVCRTGALDPALGDKVFSLVSSLKRRKQPRRNSNYPIRHFLDTGNKCFSVGKEIHARLPTGLPHNVFCRITGIFRFGRKLPLDRHFNVAHASEGSRLSGTFPNCHDEQTAVAEVTHLNMFSNDHY